METEPLLHDDSDVSTENDVVADGQQPDHLDISQNAVFFGCIFALKFLVQFTTGILELPLLRLVERAICRRVLGYINVADEEAACKVASVQDKLALIMGFKWAFDSLPCEDCNIPSVKCRS
jgi:hypothetical protein